MPKGPNDQKRPADSIGVAVMVAKIATGEAPDNPKSGRVASGKAGGAARASSLSPEERSAISQKAAKTKVAKVNGGN